MRSFSNNDGDGNENGKKNNRFKLAKQQLCTCITLFCTFLSRRCKSATWNFLISRARFMELMNTAQEFSFSFCKLRYGPFGFNPRQFRQDFKNKKKLNKIAMKFETVRGIHFLRDVFALLSSGNFATMATWPNDFSSLLAEEKKGS